MQKQKCQYTQKHINKTIEPSIKLFNTMYSYYKNSNKLTTLILSLAQFLKNEVKYV